MIGCPHSCLYCYAKANAIRFGKATPKSWAEEKQGKLPAVGREKEGAVMFPTAHDITAINVDYCRQALYNLVQVWDKVLVVSKPNSEVIKRLLHEVDYMKPQILLRFTIGSMDPGTLRFWEPNAPTFAERLYSLMWAFRNGWQTSVSMEPMLDTNHNDALRLARTVAPYVTDAIWIGKANKLGQRCSMNAGGSMDQGTSDMVFALEKSQGNAAIIQLHDKVMSDPVLAPKVKWKESIKKVMGIESPDGIGLDI